jgi:predicted lysophospholipase L1 biosynthesis ABC-type transport system permease subunit
MMAECEGLLRTFRRLLEGTNFRRPTLTFVAAGMRRRMDAILPHGKLVVLTIRQLLGNLSRHKTLTFVVAGAVGLAFILLLLEISVRNELAKEASDAAIDAVPAPSASP